MQARGHQKQPSASVEHAPAWRCEVCTRPLNPMTNDGSLYFSYSEWWAYREADKAWTAAHTDEHGWLVCDALALAQAPELRWHVVHDRCDRAAIDRYDVYWIDVDRMDTWAKVAEWSAHLSGKQWFADTDWGALLYAAGVGKVAS
jgi:hypothetical protein